MQIEKKNELISENIIVKFELEIHLRMLGVKIQIIKIFIKINQIEIVFRLYRARFMKLPTK